MAKLTEIENEILGRVLITGLPGSGKSTLAAMLAGAGYNLLWIDTENGAELLTKFPAEIKEHINLISLPDSASYPIAADTLMQLFKKGYAKICLKHGKVDCALCAKEGGRFDEVDFNKLGEKDIVVLDTVTQLSHSILAHLTKDEKVDYKPERDDWGGLRKFTEFFGSQFQAVRFKFICIAHITEAEMLDGKEKYVPNFGSKSMSAEFAKFFGHVIFCEVVNGEHRAGSSSTYSNKALTKSRTDFRIEDLVTPSLLPIFDRSVELPKKAIKPTTILSASNTGTTNANTALANLKNLVAKK
jgi:hypothetical protein